MPESYRSVAKRLKCDMIFNDHFIANLMWHKNVAYS